MPHVLQIIFLADLWLQATALPETTLSHRVFGESKKLALLRQGSDLTLARYRNALRWFQQNWPPETARPFDLFDTINAIVTEDGIWIARCSATGATATGRTLDEAVAELPRPLAASEAA